FDLFLSFGRGGFGMPPAAGGSSPRPPLYAASRALEQRAEDARDVPGVVHAAVRRALKGHPELGAGLPQRHLTREAPRQGEEGLDVEVARPQWGAEPLALALALDLAPVVVPPARPGEGGGVEV